MSIVSESNKQMLFDLLQSIGIENQFSINRSQLSNFINNRCIYFHTNRFEFDYGNDLNKVNKKIVEQGYNYIMSNQPVQNKPKVESNKQPPMSKREMFETGLATQEAQFKKMINPNKPKEIDFADGSKDFPIPNLDNLINQTLADRQKELESITQKYSSNDRAKAQQWLNREEDTPRIKIEKSSNLKLDNAITDLALQPKPQRDKIERRVRFEVNDTVKEPKKGLTNLFSKLKQKTPNSDISIKLDTIISYQNKIIGLLTSKNNIEVSTDEINLSAI